MLVDTGAQSSIMSPNIAANLSLPFEPDFEVDVCGVGGLVSSVPGYWIDFVKINALGGSLEYSKAPFVILDLASPEGGSLDGVLGMSRFGVRVVYPPATSMFPFLFPWPTPIMTLTSTLILPTLQFNYPVSPVPGQQSSTRSVTISMPKAIATLT